MSGAVWIKNGNPDPIMNELWASDWEAQWANLGIALAERITSETKLLVRMVEPNPATATKLTGAK